MSIDPLSDWWVHDVTIQPYAGTGPEGDTYGASYQITGYVASKRTLVRGPTGGQEVSATTLLAPSSAADIPVGSIVTLPAIMGLHRTRVISFTRHDAGSQPTPNHIEAALA